MNEQVEHEDEVESSTSFYDERGLSREERRRHHGDDYHDDDSKED